MIMDTDALLAEASLATAAIASNVTESQLSGATPCSEFDVKGLVNHIAGFEGHQPDAGVAKENLSRISRGDFRASSNPNITLFEIVIHGWDLAKSTGQELRVSDEIGEAIFGITQRIFRNHDRRGEGKAFGAEISIADGASAFEKALALTGRDSNWSI